MNTKQKAKNNAGLVEITVLLAVAAFWLLIDLVVVAPSAMDGLIIPDTNPIPGATTKW